MAARELGNSLGNPLARSNRSKGLTNYTEVFIASGSGVYRPPEGFNSMRVTCVGAGASGASGGSSSGGGGGCCMSPVVLPSPVVYMVGVGGVAGTYAGSLLPSVNGTNTTAAFGAFNLLARSPTNGSTGGTASGGLTNFSGGNGSGTGGGGAGGTTSAGANGDLTSTGNGGGGGTNGGSAGSSGGGGIGARGGHAGVATGKDPAFQAWGTPGSFSVGGWPGGGGGSVTNGTGGDGGNGGIRIELW